MLFSLNKLPLEAVINFSKQLHVLLTAGIPLYRSVQIILSQNNNTTYKKVLTTILENLAEGSSLADSLANFPENFSPFFISMVKIGESQGELDKALARVNQHLEIMRTNKQKIVNALTYPLLLLSSSISVLLLMIIFVLPKFITIFSQAEITLPTPTKILFNINIFFQNYFLLIVLFLISLPLGYLFLNKYPKTKKVLDSYKLKIPLMGELLTTVYISRFCRTFGTLYQSGTELLESIELSKPTLNNSVLTAEIDKLIKSIHNGEGLSQPLAKSKVFPPMMSQMIEVGEQSGKLDKLLIEVAVYYEQEADYKIQKQLSLIEPISLMIISGMVAFIASAIMLPLFKMASTIRTF